MNESQWRACEAALDPAERSQAQRLRWPADQRAYIVAHALRRQVLGNVLQLPPGRVPLGSDALGRPVLRGDAAGKLFFSHSRRRDLVAFALGRAGPLGIDVEAIRPMPDFGLLARFIVLPEGEPGSTPAERDRRFFFYWTALEAFWKAQGTGLPSAGARIVFDRTDPGPGELWLEHAQAAEDKARRWTVDAGPAHAVALVLKHASADEGSAAGVRVTLHAGHPLIE